MKCEKCEAEFSLWKLAWKKGCCPSCGTRLPVSDYCPGVPDRRWWRLFRGAPLGLKLSAIILILLGFLTVFHFCFAGFQILMAEGRWALVQGVAFYVIFGVIILHVLRAVVRGRIPYVCIAALVTFSVYVTDAFAESLVVIVPLLIFALSFLTPAARRWRRKISDEDLAYWIAARSGAFPFWRKVALFVLKTTAMGLLLFGCMGVFALDPDSIERICDWINDRSVELVACLHPGGLPLREGTYYLPCSGWKWATWVEVKKGSVAGEYTIVRTFKVLNPVDESDVTIADEKRGVDEYEVRQVAGRERLEVLKRRECVYLFKDGEAEPVREGGEADRARDSVLIMQRGDILIVNGLAYSLVRRLWTKQPEQKVEPLREGRYYSTNHDWQGCWIEVKKGCSEDEYILEETGSGRDTEPYDAKGFVVRQRPDQTRLEILKAYACPCGPVVDGDSPIRKSEEISGGKCNWMSIIVSGDFLIVNGLVYSFKERWWEVDE